MMEAIAMAEILVITVKVDSVGMVGRLENEDGELVVTRLWVKILTGYFTH